MSERVAEEEHAFNFERQEDEPSPIVSKFQLHGLHEKIDRLEEKIVLPIKDVAKAAADGMKAAMKSLTRPGPDPDNENDFNERLNTVERRLERASYGDYHERQRDPREDKGPSWKERVLTICGTLVVIGIPALVIMYGQLSALKSTQDAQAVLLANQQAQINQLTQLMLNRRQ